MFSVFLVLFQTWSPIVLNTWLYCLTIVSQQLELQNKEKTKRMIFSGGRERVHREKAKSNEKYYCSPGFLFEQKNCNQKKSFIHLEMNDLFKTHRTRQMIQALCWKTLTNAWKCSVKVVVSFACLISLCKTIKVIYWFFPGILMIRQPCNLNEQGRVLTSEAATGGVL